MERGRSGRVVALDIATGRVRTIASGLQYAFGACAAGDAIFVSESWRHRVLSLPARAGSMAEVLIGDLPAYPARLAPASDGGFWLALFAPRVIALFRP